MGDWPVHDAKARFSALIERANSEGPQQVTRHGKPVAVVLAEAEYRRLLSVGPERRNGLTFGQFLLTAPHVDFDLVELLEADRQTSGDPTIGDIDPDDWQ